MKSTMDFAGEIHVFFDVGDVGDVDIPQGVHISHGKSPFLLVKVRSPGTHQSTGLSPLFLQTLHKLGVNPPFGRNHQQKSSC